jgi:hypothetical protein
MIIDKIPGTLSHKLLSQIMPFYCCWLVDTADETQPCSASVMGGSSIYSTRLALLGINSSEVPWVN